MISEILDQIYICTNYYPHLFFFGIAPIDRDLIVTISALFNCSIFIFLSSILDNSFLMNIINTASRIFY